MNMIIWGMTEIGFPVWFILSQVVTLCSRLTNKLCPLKDHGCILHCIPKNTMKQVIISLCVIRDVAFFVSYIVLHGSTLYAVVKSAPPLTVFCCTLYWSMRLLVGTSALSYLHESGLLIVFKQSLTSILKVVWLSSCGQGLTIWH